LCGAALALILAAPPATAQETATALEPVAAVEGITEYRLENGLRVLLFPDTGKIGVP
jgi:zinc protease